MYQVPLRFINASPTVAICATRIVAIMSIDSYQARETIKMEKRAGTLINASGSKATKCAIILDNGAVVASPYTVKRICARIQKAEEAAPEFDDRVGVVLPDEEETDDDFDTDAEGVCINTGIEGDKT